MCPVLEGGVARYLRPEARVVSFWPRAELDDLAGWVISPEHVAVSLVTGEAGSGKTRLALRLADQVSEHGWRTRWVRSRTEEGAVRAVREAGAPVLLVVDYAETRTSLSALLAGAVGGTGGGPAMRVLLLARSAGEWWQQLISGSGYQLSELLVDRKSVV